MPAIPEQSTSNQTPLAEENLISSGDPTFGGRPFVGGHARQKFAITNDFQQAGERYRSLSTKDQDHLVDNIVDPLSQAKKDIQKRMVEHLTKADKELGGRVAKGLNL